MLGVFKALVEEGGDLHSPAVASRLDAADTLASFRDEFHIPLTESTAEYRTPGNPTIYLCGNSLGLQPKSTRAAICRDLDTWADHGVEGHFKTV